MHGSVGHVIIFKGGKRIDKPVKLSKFPEAVALVKKLKADGVKAHFAYLTDRRMYPPPREVVERRAEGYLWCPYCGAWRWFKVPKAYKDPELGTREWYLTSFHNQLIRVCAWCEISETDWYIKRANNTFGEGTSRRRRRTRRAKR